MANSWKSSSDFSFMKITAIVMIVASENYIVDEKVMRDLGAYLEYGLNKDYIIILKWTNQMNA